MITLTNAIIKRPSIKRSFNYGRVHLIWYFYLSLRKLALLFRPLFFVQILLTLF